MADTAAVAGSWPLTRYNTPMAERENQGELRIDLPLQQVAAFCKKWKIVELSVFGSALRDDFGPDSDLDFLFTVQPGARLKLWELPDAERELAELLGRKVDLVSRNGIEQSRNWIRKGEILQSARIVYDA